MPTLKKEIRLLISFLRAQIPRLHQARLEAHNIGLKRCIAWVATIQLATALLSALLSMPWAFGLSHFFSVVSSSIIGSVWAALFTAFIYTLWTALFGALIQHKRKDLNWDHWFEFTFLCSLPLAGAGLLISFFATLAWPLWMAALGYAAYLFYTAIKLRFSLPGPKDYALLKGALALIIILNIGIQWHTQSLIKNITSDFDLSTLGLDPESPYGPIPPEKIKAVRALYPGEENKQNAAEQFAKAVWAFLAPPDLEEARLRIDRAVQCTMQNGLERSDAKRIKSIVLNSVSLTRMYLETDNRLSGRVYNVKDYGSKACDF